MPSKKQKIKQRLLPLQNGKCIYCESEITLQTATLEHIVPKVIGKQSDDLYEGNTNLKLSCDRCNKLKGCMELHVFEKWCEYAKTLEKHQNYKDQTYFCKVIKNVKALVGMWFPVPASKKNTIKSKNSVNFANQPKKHTGMYLTGKILNIEHREWVSVILTGRNIHKTENWNEPKTFVESAFVFKEKLAKQTRSFQVGDFVKIYFNLVAKPISGNYLSEAEAYKIEYMERKPIESENNENLLNQ